MTHQILHGVPYWNVFFEDARATKLVDLLTCNDFQTMKVLLLCDYGVVFDYRVFVLQNILRSTPKCSMEYFSSVVIAKKSQEGSKKI